ncbi:MAG TPA: methyltransferase domain-containing protein [Actinomycetes bacterium]
MKELPAHVRRNREYWKGMAAGYEQPGRRHWAEDEPTWGIWGVPESELRLLPDELAGRDVVELGCGTGYVSAWLARRGARPVGVDVSDAQLASARRFQREFGVAFPLLLASAEQVPLVDERFDLVISEYGASIWCDPYRWVPEAARLLRPGGRLVFLTNGVLLMLCTPDQDGAPACERLLRPYFGMHRFEWPDDPSVEFHLGHGEMLRLLRSCGFEVEDLLEVRPPEGATSRHQLATLEWARRWPCEEVWKARKVTR